MAGCLLAVAILFCFQGWSSGWEEGSYLQLFSRSFCQPREVVVKVHEEHPQETVHLFRPSCVALQRCSGCCNDESLKCFAVRKRTTHLQIMQVNPNTQTLQMEGMDFREHVTCECRPREENRANRKRKRSQEKGEPGAKLPLV